MSRSRPKLENIFASLGIALGLVLVFWGVQSGTTGRDALGYPDAIIDINPAPNDKQVLAQTELLVDFADGYRGSLTIDDIEIPTTDLEDIANKVPEPGQQVEMPLTAIYDQGNSLIRFQPTDGAVIENYGTGVHEVVVRYWNIVDGESTARSYRWTFEVL